MNKNTTKKLLSWYSVHQRNLPWRKTKDPYAILVAEMMLQQTQVSTVIDYYQRFLVQFPSFVLLANASEQAVLNAWQGLGYYRRAKNLHKLAKIVVADYKGKLPNDAVALKALPGIGDYMLGAVRSIAFGIAHPAIDGNYLRVVARVDNMTDDVTKIKVKTDVAARIKAIMPDDEASSFTQAMMDLGAMVCKPKNALCCNCPLNDECLAYKDNAVSKLPYKTPKKKPVATEYYVPLIVTADALLMKYRDDKGLLANMWGLPMYKKSQEVQLQSAVDDLLGINTEAEKSLGVVTHVFTHKKWVMEVVVYKLTDKMLVPKGYAWQKLNQLSDIPIPVAFSRVIKLLPWFNDTVQSKM